MAGPFNAQRPAFGGGRVSFAAAPPAPVPRHAGQARGGRAAQLAEAAQAVEVLPAAGEFTLALMTGRYDLAELVACAIDRLGPVAHLRVATLAFSRRNLDLMTRLLDAGTVRRLTLLCSKFFRRHNGEVYQALRDAFRDRGQRAAASRSHCKIVCIDFAAGDPLLLEGSPNLRTNSNLEQLVMIRDRAAHDFRAAFIDSEVAAHEGDQGDNPGAG
jgi:hypothetical protein